MPYLTCPTCGLTLAALGSRPDIDHCPRCRARSGTVIEMMARRRPSANPAPGRLSNPPPGARASRSADTRPPLGSLGAPPPATLEESHATG